MKNMIILLSVTGLLFLTSLMSYAQNAKTLYDAVASIEQKYPDLQRMNLKSAMTDTETSREKMLLNDIRDSRFYKDLVKYVVLNNQKMAKEFVEAETADTLGFYYMYINTAKKDIRKIKSADRSKNILGVGAGIFRDNFGFGYSLEIDYDIFVSRRLSLGIGFGYHRQNKKKNNYAFEIPDTEFLDYGSSSSKYRVFSSDKISIPVGITYYLPLTNGIEDLEVVNLMFYAGAEFFYGLNMKETISLGSQNCWDHVSETYVSWNYDETKDLFSGKFSGAIPDRSDIYQHVHKYIAFDENTYKRADLCLSFGVGIQLTRWFEVWAGYKQGVINKIASPDGNTKYLNNFYLRLAFNIIH